MQIEALYYLTAIDKYGSTRKAAAQLNTSYQNVSRVLKQTEEEVGMLLFLRTTTGLFPTEEGKLAVTSAKKMIEIYENMLEQFEYRKELKADGQIVGNLDVVSSIMIASAFLNEFLVDFSIKYPKIQVNLREEEAYLLKDREERHFYLTSRLTEDIKREKENIIPLIKDRMIILTKKDSVFNGQKSISLKQISKWPLVLVAKNNWKESLFGHIFSLYNIELEKFLVTSSITGSIKCIESGKYVGVSTKVLFSKLSQKLFFDTIMIRDEGVEFYHCLIIVDNSNLTPIEQIFVKSIKEYFHII